MKTFAVLFSLIVATHSFAQEPGDIVAYNADKSFRVTLHSPTNLSWNKRKRTPVRISLKNISNESRFAFDTFWNDSSIFCENIGKGPSGWGIVPMLIIHSYVPTSETQFMHKLDPGMRLTGSMYPGSAWFFELTPNGSYKVNIVYDDTTLWPANMRQQRIGRVVIPLTMHVTNESLSFVARKPSKGEVGRPPLRFMYQCWPEKFPDYMKQRKVQK